jgi:hypothetical protein
MSKRTFKRLQREKKVIVELSKVYNQGKKDELKLYNVYQLR